MPEVLQQSYRTVKSSIWGQIVDGQKFYPLHEAQRDVLDSTVRFTAAIAGTGGGKTVIGPLWLAKQIQKSIAKNEFFLGMVLAPTYKVLSRATIPTLIETFSGTHLEGTWKESKNLYVLPNGIGQIWCQGVDSPGGIEGGQFSAIWGDEAGQFKNMAWTAMQGRAGAKQAPILLTTTPYGRNWLWTDFYKRFSEGDKDYYVRQWASHYNPAYPKEEYDRAKRTMTAEKAAMRYDGLFTQMEGLVYPSFEQCVLDEDPSNIIAMDGRLLGGVDFGWNDPFAALSGLLTPDDILFVWYERYKSETPIEVHAEKMPKFQDRHILWYTEHEPELVRRLQKGGHKCRNANKAIIAGIDAVNRRILSGKLFVLREACPATIAEASVYTYPEKDEEIIGDKPVDKDNHAMDALRYMVAGIDIRKAA